MRYEVDDEGVDLIAGFEGYTDGVYNDSRGFCTGGFGHLFHESAATVDDHRKYDGLGKAFWLRLLHEDIQRDAIVPMNAYLTVSLAQKSINAVASAAYNCGPGFVTGTVGRLINEHNYDMAAAAFMLWDNPPELIPRRQKEEAIFLQGVHEKAPQLAFPWLESYERKAVLEYDRLLRAGKNIARRVELRKQMTAYRKIVWHAAQGPGGWEIHHRRQRYRTLWART